MMGLMMTNAKRGGRIAPERIAPMYGPARLLTPGQAWDLVVKYGDGRSDVPTMLAIAKRIAVHGECLVHATCEVVGTPCWAFCCKPEAQS